MTDYTHLVTDSIRILDGNSNGGTPYDVLVLDITEHDVGLFTQTRYGGDGVPISVWDGRVRRFTLAKGRAVIDLGNLRLDLAEGGKLSVLIDRIQDGLGTRWDGSNMKGGLTDDAVEAEEELDSNLDGRWTWVDDNCQIWDESDWIADEARALIKADTTDEQIDAYLAEVRANVPTDCYLTGDARDWLIELRDDRKEIESE